MARARNIKPGFFTNEVLAEVPPLGRILFEGLWCWADRAGRLEDRPKRLKAEILPYDDCDIEELLSALSDRNFIHRYMVNGIKYIQVLAFNKHQNPHCKESESTIPAPDKHGAGTMQEHNMDDAGTGKSGASPADSLFSDSLKPSTTLVPDTGDGNSVSELEAKREAKQKRLSEITKDAIETYNESPFTRGKGGSCPNIQPANLKAQEFVKRCIKQASAICNQAYGSPTITRDFWIQYWETVDADDFHAGRLPRSPGHENWNPDFEFLTHPKQMAKLFDRAMSENAA